MTNNTRYSRSSLCDARNRTLIANGLEYKLEGNIGNGAIGVVRKARSLKSGSQVAIKFLAPEPRYIEQSSLEDICARFKREGTRGLSLAHDHLVKVLAHEDNDEGICFGDTRTIKNPFIVMELVRGRTLESHINRSEPGLGTNVNAANLRLALQITEALAYLHERRIVHRDVKPANIFVAHGNTPRSAKLGDFGVVKWGDFKASLTTGTMTVSGQQGLGTFKYMSPEQAVSPKDVTVRSDMYSLGITLFELFTGHILQSPHHVFRISQARVQRGSMGSKLHSLGIGHVPTEFDDLFEPLLDMFLTGAQGRPSSKSLVGRLRYVLGRFE